MVCEYPIHHTKAIKSTATASAVVCKQILSQLRENGFSQDDIFAVHLSLEEALTNAVKHGNRMDPTKKVRVDYTIKQGSIEISVNDQGVGFDPEDVPDPRCGENLYRMGGRGLFLMRAYMDHVEFRDSGNTVYMVREKHSPTPDKETQ